MTFLKVNLWQHHKLVAVLITVIVVNIFELGLLHYKYDIFKGGFLQPYSYKEISERTVFIGLSLFFDFSLCSLLASFWFFIANQFNKRSVIVSINFAALIILVMGLWLVLKFKILSYFSDTINLNIIINLGGGSLKEALLYISNEVVLFAGIAFLTTATLFFTIKLVKTKSQNLAFTFKTKQSTFYKKLIVLILLLAPVITYFVSEHAFLRYGAEKKTSYRLISNGLDKLSDFDSDGVGSFSYPKDKAIFNAHIYPSALDIPNNGIDEDGFLGDAILPSNNKDHLTDISPKKGKHIILIVLESARSDLLEAQLHGQYVAPVMRKLAKEGVAASNAYSHTGYTTTSLKALFNRELIDTKKPLGLIDFLQSSGYKISIISGQDESFGDVALKVGMKNVGVNYFDARTAINDRVFPSKEAASLRLSEARIVKEFQSEINALDFSQPQFLYLNFQAAHFPYSNPKMTKYLVNNFIPRSEIKQENKDWVTATYWNAIASADWAIGEIIKSLTMRDLFKNTIIVILGDHGEALFDDGFLGHGHAINDIQTKIPLIVNDPTIVIDEPIGQVDVAEITVRSALGLTNHWAQKNKVVFQLVGSLSQPELIAHVEHNGARTIFNFHSEQVFFSELSLWKPYKEVLLDPVNSKRVVELIRHWEALRWNEYNINKNKPNN